MSSIYDFTATALTGEPVRLAQYRGRVLLIVNTASACGFTPQYRKLQALHERFNAQGLEVLGFPCNQFGAQEPGDAAAIGTFCDTQYGITFALFNKVEVNGADAHPLFKHLKQAAPGVLGSQAIKWNFTKFLVDREGNVVGRYAPLTKPEHLTDEIEALLGPAT